MRRHRVRGHDPAALAQLVRDGELVEVVVVLGVQAEGDKREALALSLAGHAHMFSTECPTTTRWWKGSLPHDNEAELLEARTEVVGRPGQVHHDGPVADLAEADELVCSRGSVTLGRAASVDIQYWPMTCEAPLEKLRVKLAWSAPR